MTNKPRILLVMHDLPVESGFLAAKFIWLSELFDVHLLVWDTKQRLEQFVAQYNIPGKYRQKIHLGIHDFSGVLPQSLGLLNIVLSDSKVRRFVFSTPGSFSKKLKTIITYLPVFKLKPDIIHFEFGTLALNIATLKQLIDSKMVVSFRGYDINYAGLNDSEHYKEVWQHTDALHFLGTDIKKRSIKRGYKEDKTEVMIPPAIDLNFFNAANKTYGANSTKLRIVSVGRAVWKKGFEYGIRAMAVLKEKGIPFEYHIIGDGAHLQALAFTITESGLTDNVILTGKKSTDEIKAELSNADIFLHPAVSEGFSNAVIEAQAMGLPVICTDADGLAENIEDGVTGFVVPKWDAQAIADKLEWFWNNKPEIERTGKAGIARVNKKYKIEDQIDAFKELYQNLYSGA